MPNVIVCDHQPVFRAGIQRVFSSVDDFRVVAQCFSWNRLCELVARYTSSLVVASTLVVADSAALVALSMSASSRVLLIAESTEPYAEYRASGVAGIIRRTAETSDFLEYARLIHRGTSFVPPRDCAATNDVVGSNVAARLTRNEMRILALIMEGMKNKEIAARLHTTEQVIKNYLRVIYDKVGVSDRLELAIFTMHHCALRAVTSEALALSA